MNNTTRNVVLIGCVKRKLGKENPNKKFKVQDLYSPSIRFRSLLSYARFVVGAKESDIYVISAKHHVIGINDETSYYDQTLSRAKKSVRLEWSEKVISQIKTLYPSKTEKIHILAGKSYYEFIEPVLRNEGYTVNCVLKGKGRLGEQQKWINTALKNTDVNKELFNDSSKMD